MMKKIIRTVTCICLLCGIILFTCSGIDFSNVSANNKFGIQYINVKDFGAVGDGVTDDKAAIVSALKYAVNNLPATVYFPEGEYGILNGGIYLSLPLGSGGLTVKGEGGGKSVIKYLEDWETSGTWVALRIQPESKPENEEEYIHDITISDLGVYDTNPVNHAWTIEKNGAKEETHGFDIQYCVRATVQNCLVNNVGDEAIDMIYCIDSVITNNSIKNSPGAGSAGGAISAGDGCKNVRITNNSVTGSIQGKDNFGIAVEALIEPVNNIVISNNTITDLIGYGINIGAPNGTIDDVVVSGNSISDCSNGIRFMGSGQKSNINMTGNIIKNVNTGIIFDGRNTTNAILDSFIIDGISDIGIRVVTMSVKNTIISNGVITNSQKTAIYNAGIGTKISDIMINGTGLAGGVKTAAILQYSLGGDSEVTRVTLKNCKNTKAIQGVQTVIDTCIEQDEVAGYVSISGAKIIKGGKVNRVIQGLKNEAIINGLEIYTESELGTHAIDLQSRFNCIITNCRINIPSKHAIRESGTSDYNLITNNITNKKISIIGENTVSEMNILSE